MAYGLALQVHGIAYPLGKDSLPAFHFSFGMHSLPCVQILGKDG
jgi:hypothetical protein